MKTFDVYLTDWDALRALDDDRETLCRVTWDGDVVAPELYAEPYRLEAADLDDVFRILNTAHPADWRARSLSVGDVVVDEAGTAYACRRVGWTEVAFTAPGEDPDPWTDGMNALERALKRAAPGEELTELARDPAVASVAGVVDRLHRCLDGETLCFVLVEFTLANPTGAPWPVVGVFERETWTVGAFASERDAVAFVDSLS